MSEIKAIEKLREFVDDQFAISGQAYLQGMAIANSIEAEIAERYMKLPSGTCRIVKTPSDSDFSDGWRYRCSECGCNIPVNERDPETGDVINAANYCPNCGAKVVS